MARIYVSSTFSDLEDYRQEVNLSLRRLGHDDIAMEYYVAEDLRPLDRCLADVASCDLYIGIFAWRYGYIPGENNAEERSITELEYQQAQENGIHCLIFLLSEDAPWPRSKQDKGAAAEKIEALHQELSERHMVSFFETSDELTRKVNEAVIRWEKSSGQQGKRQLTDWDAYRRAVSNRHQWVRLQVIAGAGREKGITRIPLTEVFEPQLVALGASPTDLPEEVRRYQEVIFRDHQPTRDKINDRETKEGEIDRETVEQEAEEFLFSANPQPVLDILGREPTQVLLGGPGTGKSTILHFAMLRVCQESDQSNTLPANLQSKPLPFLIELRNYVLQKTPDFISYIVLNSRDFYGAPVEAESLVKALEQGKALLFFDGLDEVFDPDERSRVINQFRAFAHRYPRARITVTTRIAGYDRTALGLAGFEHYTILPLTLAQISHFVGQWYRYYTLEGSERTPQALIQRIVENPRLLDLAGNPLLLTMMAVIYKDRDLPNERWRLYERCAETLLEDWDVSKGFEDEDFKLGVLLRTAQKSEILQQVSMYMLEHGQEGRELNAISYAPLLEIVTNYLEEKYPRSRGDNEVIAEKILGHLMERTYVLAGIGERIFGFVHRTFMEYFAAVRCQKQFNARGSDFDWLKADIYGAHWQGGEWEEVLLLLIAILHDQETQIREVVEYLRNECKTDVPYNTAFAARCLGEAGDVQDPSQGQSLLAELSGTIAAHAPQTRKEEARLYVDTALKAFAMLAPLVAVPAEVQAVIDQLNNEGSVASRMAAWQMGFALRSRSERLDYALEALKNPEEVVRRGAIAALEREWPGRADIGPSLTEVVRRDRYARVRQAALAALQRSWPYEPTILDGIASRVDQETAFTYVIQLMEYLAETWRGNPAACKLVVRLAGPKPKARYDYDYGSVAMAAGQSLANGWGGDSQMLEFLLEQTADDPDSQTEKAVLQGIAQGWSTDVRALTFLQERAAMDPDAATRETVLQAIAHGWCGDAEVLSFLKDRAMNDPNPGIRRSMVLTIGEEWVGDPQALNFLKERAVHDPRPRTRAAVLNTLARGWQDAAVLDFLKERTTQDPDPQTRAAGLQAIAESWEDAEVLEFLRERAVDETNPQTRTAVLQSIAWNWSGNAVVIDFLKERAENDPDQETRSAVFPVIVMGWDYDQAVDFLKERAVNDPEPQTRSVVFQVLARNWGGDPKILDFLMERASKDPAPQARAAALQAIAQQHWDGSRVLEFLRERAENDLDPKTRSAGLKAIALDWFEEPTVIGFLKRQACNDPAPETRSELLLAIAETHRYWYWGFIDDEEGSISNNLWLILRDRALMDPDLSVRDTAITALAEMTHWFLNVPEMVDFLLDRGKNDSENTIRLRALAGIAYSGFLKDDPITLKFLREQAIHHPEGEKRVLALSAIAEGWQDVTEEINFVHERAVNDPQISVRVRAFAALGNMDQLGEDPHALSFLREQAVDHPDADIRSSALWAIATGWSDRAETLAFLQERASSDPAVETRLAGLRAVQWGWASVDRVLDFLEDRGFNDPDANIRSEINEWMGYQLDEW